jgi:cytochrome c55X
MPVQIQSIQAGLAAVMVGLTLLGSPPVWAADPPANAEVTLSTARRSELITLVRQDCGSCHGLTLQGGLGPALLPQTLQDKPADYLQFVILNGRPGTAMPPWSRFLNEAEAAWVVRNLQKGFPRGH